MQFLEYSFEEPWKHHLIKAQNETDGLLLGGPILI